MLFLFALVFCLIIPETWAINKNLPAKIINGLEREAAHADSICCCFDELLMKIKALTNVNVARKDLFILLANNTPPDWRNTLLPRGVPGYLFSEQMPVENLHLNQRNVILLLIRSLSNPVVENALGRFPSIMKILFVCADVLLTPERVEKFIKENWWNRRIYNIFFVEIQCDAEKPGQPSYLTVYQPYDIVLSPIGKLLEFSNIQRHVICEKLSNSSCYNPLMESEYNHSFSSKLVPLVKLEGASLPLTLFPTTMAYSKKELTILHKDTFQLQNNEANARSMVDEYFGEDLEVLKELSRLMHFKPVASLPLDNGYYGYRLDNGTFTGGLEEALKGRSAFLVNGYFIKDYETRDLEFSTAIGEDKLCVIVREADLIPESLMIFRCFTTTVWILILITIFIVGSIYTVVLHLIGVMGLHPLYSRIFTDEARQSAWNVMNSYFRIIGPLLLAPITGIRSVSYDRVFIAACFLWSLNLLGAFQSSLVDVYTIRKSYANLHTLDDLDRSGLMIYVRHKGLIVDVFGEKQPGTPIGNLRRKLVDTENDLLNDWIARYGLGTGLERITDIHNFKYKYIREDGRPLLRAVNECPRSYRLAYLFRKTSPLLDTVNFYIHCFNQHGFSSKWKKDTEHIFELQGGLVNRNYILSSRIRLTLGHLQIAFIVLLIGIVISVIAFIVEIYI